MIQLRRSIVHALLASSLLAAATPIAWSQQTYTSNGSGKWEDPTTWSPAGGPPTANDHVVIRSGDTVTKNPPVPADKNAPVTAQSITIQPNAEIKAEKVGDPLVLKARDDIDNKGRISTADATGAGGSGGGIIVISTDGGVSNQGSIKAGNGKDGVPGGPKNGGDGGRVQAQANGPNKSITNTGTIGSGSGGRGASTNAANQDAGDGGDGGKVTLEAKGEVFNGPGARIDTGSGGHGGSATGANSEAGDGGDGGKVLIGAKDEIDNAGIIQTGGGGNGGNTQTSGEKGGLRGAGGSIQGGGTVDSARKETSGKPERAHLDGATKAGKNGINGTGPDGEPTAHVPEPKVDIVARTVLEVGPGASNESGWLLLDANDVRIFGVQGGAIRADIGINVFATGMIDLTGNLAGVDVLTAAERVRLTVPFPGSLLLDGGVTLASITDVDADVFTIQWNDGFELYPFGGSIVGQGGWTGWNDVFQFDAVPTINQTRGELQSLELKLSSDVVRVHGGITTGRAVMRTFVYVSSQPPDALLESAWFVLLSSYGVPVTPTNTSWAVQVELDAAAGEWRIDAGSASTAHGALVFDAWIELRADIDLDQDTVQVFYGGSPMAPAYSWSGGVFGGASDPLDLAAINLYAPTTSPMSVVYWDDLTLALSGPPAATTYCTAKVNSQGCTPQIGWSGTPSATLGLGFSIGASSVLNNKNGLFFYGTQGKHGLPFQGGFLCVKPPIKRTPVQTSGGNPPPNDCSGAYAIDFNVHIASGIDPALTFGASVDGQYWARDPGFAPPTNTSLTDGIHFVIAP